MLKHILVHIVLLLANVNGHHVELHAQRNHALPVVASVAR